MGFETSLIHPVKVKSQEELSARWITYHMYLWGFSSTKREFKHVLQHILYSKK